MTAVDVAQSTTVQMESERLRNSLLAAISHDLRTPLAALVGMADMLALADPLSGRVPLSHVAGARLWTPPTIALFCRLPNEVTYRL